MAEKGYTPDLLTQAITSDTATNVASGVEALGRGLFPKGTFNALEVGLGGATQEQIDTRDAALGTAGDVAEFGGQMMRDSAAIALGGPAALFGMAALNTVGDTAQQAVNHSPDLTAEHVAGTLFNEMLSATAGTVLGKALPVVANATGRVLAASGRALVGHAENAIGKTISKVSELEAPQFMQAAKEALDKGLFGKARKHAAEQVGKEVAEMQGAMKSYLAPFDDAATSFPGEPLPSATQWAKTAEKAVKQWEFLNPETPFGALTPSKALEIENFAAQQSKVATGKEANAWMALQQKLKPLTDKYHADSGVAPVELRGMQQKLAAQEATLAAIPKEVITPQVIASAKHAAKVGAGIGALQVAGVTGAIHDIGHSLGLPLGHIATGALGLYGLKGALKGAVPLGAIKASAKASLAQTEHNVGRALSEFDKGIFSQDYANTVGEEMAGVVRKAMQGDVAVAVREGADEALEQRRLANLQALAQSPEVFQANAIKAIDNLPILEDQKPQVLNIMAHALEDAKSVLPAANPLAPPGSRALGVLEQVKLKRKLKAITDPQSVVHSPTKEGKETLAKVRPASHAAIIRAALLHAGPNINPGTRARQLLDSLGVDKSIDNAGKQAQGLYAPRPMAAPQMQQQRREPINLNVVHAAPTKLDAVEKGSP